jgi:hypothetical protein
MLRSFDGQVVEAEGLGINLQKALVARRARSAKIARPHGKAIAEEETLQVPPTNDGHATAIKEE